ncbi:MAG: alpha/beta fold hydrolase [Gammaproteobacteria bacterium]|nr:alpha/beta fold hydrolase [Gammaproteobacteria bacterium]
MSTVCFSHGQESGPWGTKIRALAGVAREAGHTVESLDYQGMPDPQARARKLCAWCRAQPSPAILVGSSMGGYVALAAASEAGAVGLFLMAPALYVPGYEAVPVPPPPLCPIMIVHGWRDDVLPWSGSTRYGEGSGASVVLVPDDHRLVADLAGLCQLFRLFLDKLGATSSGSEDHQESS